MSKSWPVEEFNEFLRAHMDGAGIVDYAELSRLSGVSQNQFSNWRRGLAQPSRANLKKIAPVIGVKPVYLYVKAGLDEEDDFGLDAMPEYEPLPRALAELRDAYERLKALGREDYAITVISTTAAILEAEIAKPPGNQPSGRRRSG